MTVKKDNNTPLDMPPPPPASGDDKSKPPQKSKKSTEKPTRPKKAKDIITTTVIDPNSKYNPEYCKALKTHCQGGLSYESFAAKVGVCRRTLYSWELVYPEWARAKEEAYDLLLYFFERAGLAGMLGVSPKELFPHLPNAKGKFNAMAFMFMAHNRLRKDFKRNPEEIPEKPPIDKTKISDQTHDPVKAAEIYRKLMGNT